MHFKEFINRNIKGFNYESWLNPKDLALYKSLSKRIDQAYRDHDYKNAEILEVKLEELLERLDAFISEKEQEGGEEENLDIEYGLQDEMAMIYAKFINGNLDKNELIYRLRGSLIDVPSLSISDPSYRSSSDVEKIDSETLINMAKDAYLNKKALLDKKRGIAQSGRVLGLGPRGRKSESFCPDFLLENSNSFVQINLEHYKKSCLRIVEKTLDEIRDRKQKLKSFKLNINLIKDGLKNYPHLQQLLNSIDNKKWMTPLWNWHKTQLFNVDDNSFSAIRHLSDYYESLEEDEDLNEKEYYDYANDSVEKTKVAMEALKKEIERAIGNLDWNGSNVTIKPEMGQSHEELLPVSDNSASIIVGKNGLFSLFKENNKNIIDDILEADDDDEEFFSNNQEKQDYYNLISELQNPGRAKSKILTLYTARPVSDRDFYNKTTWLPANIFLTNSFNHADGLASDLSSGERRDVWKVRINSKYVIKTLEGPIQYYQVIKDKSPVESINLA